MRFRIPLALCIAPLTLALAGCFQEAGTPLQEPIPVTNQAVILPATSIPLPTEADTATGGNDNGQGQPSNTPIVDTPPGLISTDTDTIPTDEGNPPVALTIISATRPSIVTVTPLSVPTDASGQTIDPQGTPTQGQFITPSGPLGPITQVPVIAATNAAEPSATPSGLVTPTAFTTVDSTGTCTHTVQSGDTLYRIGLKYEVTVGQLRDANPQLTGDIIQPGDVMKIPDCNPTSSGTTGTSVAQPTSTSVVPATALPSGSQTYVVQRGDTLYTIGLKFGVTSAAIQKANNIANPNRINPGQELIIPAKSG